MVKGMVQIGQSRVLFSHSSSFLGLVLTAQQQVATGYNRLQRVKTSEGMWEQDGRLTRSFRACGE